MPFTLSHTAATVIFKPWLKRQKLSYTGLILGTMSPDFEYFLRMQMKGEIGHQLIGIILLNLPVALMVAVLFHLVIRDQLIEYSPKIIKKRFVIYQYENWLDYLKQHVYIVVVSILLGVLTHILWDAFTHKTGFFVEHFLILEQGISIGRLHIYMYKILQHLSSILGLALILYCVYKMPSYDLPSQILDLKGICSYWLVMLIFITVYFAMWLLLNTELMYSIGHIVVALIACTFWSLFFTSLIFKLRKSEVLK